MAVTSGFFNSLEGDRKYDALQVSKLFEGLILDGVFASIGDCFVTKAVEADVVTVGIGKAWFNHTWLLNDSILRIEMPQAELLLHRIDAIIIETDSSVAVRNNTIKYVQGAPSSSPSRPTLTTGVEVNQYPICYIYRPSGSSEITQSDITNMVGTTEMPFVTGILQAVSIDSLLGQWEDDLDRFMDAQKALFTDWMNGEKTSFTEWQTAAKTEFSEWRTTERNTYYEWFATLKADLTKEQEFLDEWIKSEQEDFTEWFLSMKQKLSDEQAYLDSWILGEQTDFIAWFNEMKGLLDGDAAGKIQMNIDKEEVDRILVAGFVDGVKTFSEDGTTITTTASDGRQLIKTFTDGFLTMTCILNSANGIEIARVTKTFDASGTTIDTVVNYT